MVYFLELEGLEMVYFSPSFYAKTGVSKSFLNINFTLEPC